MTKLPLLLVGSLATLLSLAPVSMAQDSTIVVEDFESPGNTARGVLPPGWWFEGADGGATARVEAGRLVVDAASTPDAGCTVWLDRELPEAVEIQFDVHVLESVEQANNMNLLIHFRDPINNRLSASQEERAKGTYAFYASGRLEGTIVTYVANGNPDTARVRVRRVPPFDPIVEEYRGHHAKVGHTYRFVVRLWDGRLELQVDGEAILHTPLPPRPHTKPGGYLGFRTWATKLWWDNLRIRELSPDDRPE